MTDLEGFPPSAAGQTWGPCPGCNAWQVDVLFEDVPDVDVRHVLVEEALIDHARACPPLAEICAAIGFDLDTDVRAKAAEGRRGLFEQILHFDKLTVAPNADSFGRLARNVGAEA